jgi:hypothetical protein
MRQVQRCQSGVEPGRSPLATHAKGVGRAVQRELGGVQEDSGARDFARGARAGGRVQAVERAAPPQSTEQEQQETKSYAAQVKEYGA